MKLFAVLCFVLVSSTVTTRAGSITAEEVKEKVALGFHLLRLSEGAEPVWKSEKETDELIAQEVSFVRFLSLRYIDNTS